MDILSHLDDGGAWVAAVVAGLAGIGWLLNRLRKAYKALKPWVRRAAAVIDIAEYELQHNGGGSIKDMAARIPTLQVQTQRINDQFAEHLKQADRRDQRLDDIESAVATLADSLPKD